jgi:hypothetical protein
MPARIRMTRQKYHARPCWVVGGTVADTRAAADALARASGDKVIYFHSTREARRWLELLTLERCGRISDLRRQQRFVLRGASGQVIETYVADFVYSEGGAQIVEDCKGRRTAAYRRKRRWMLSEFGITILET